jgi:hypothetical protein
MKDPLSIIENPIHHCSAYHGGREMSDTCSRHMVNGLLGFYHNCFAGVERMARNNGESIFDASYLFGWIDSSP